MIIRKAGPADYDTLARIWLESWYSTGLKTLFDPGPQPGQGRERQPQFLGEADRAGDDPRLALGLDQLRCLLLAPGRRRQRQGQAHAQGRQQDQPAGPYQVVHDRSPNKLCFARGPTARADGDRDRGLQVVVSCLGLICSSAYHPPTGMETPYFT